MLLYAGVLLLINFFEPKQRTLCGLIYRLSRKKAVSVNLYFYIKKLVANREEKDKPEQITRTISLEQLFLAGVAQRYGVRLLSRRTSVRFRFGSPFSSERLWFVDTVIL